MKKYCFACFFLLFIYSLFAQSQQEKLQKAIRTLETDPQMKHAILGFSVIDGKTGKKIFERNPQVGLAPASCQKLFISAAAFDLLGQEYRYPTTAGYDGKIASDTLHGNLHITGYGDPSLGSWRWKETTAGFFFNELIAALRKAGVRNITGDVFIDEAAFSMQPVPGGWIWEDIGNYYGAGSWGINWHENQYDLTLKAGRQLQDPVEIVSVDPPLYATLINELKTGATGSGDNSIIYLSPYSEFAFARGTIPVGETHFLVSGSMPYAPIDLAHAMEKAFAANRISLQGIFHTAIEKWRGNTKWPSVGDSLLTHYSPTLDSLNYWFLKNSINLYGEVFVKTIAYEKAGLGSTEQGVELVKNFWKDHDIESSAVNIMDGSGLSPQNRVTTDALVKVLQYAKTRPWFHSFYAALPEINGMKMKSGSISGARSYAGYQRSRNNKEYIFAIIINNYDGSSSAIVRKIWSLLDRLK